MKNIASLFTDPMKEALKRQLGVVLSDSHEYSESDLEELYDRITDDFPMEYDEKTGEPIGDTIQMEDMIDVFVRNKLIAFNTPP